MIQKQQTNQFIASEVDRNNFNNYYRCIKTLHLLSNLFLSENISKNIFHEQSKDIIERIKLLELNLKHFDLKRFIQLWQIEAQYQNIKNHLNGNIQNIKSIPIIARISNKIPQINEAMYSATTYGSIHNVLSDFISLLTKLRQQTEKKLQREMVKIIEQMERLERQMKNEYERLNTNLKVEHRELMQQNLQKFQVQFKRLCDL